MPTTESFASCPQCRSRFRVAPDASGRQAKCKKCGAVFVITPHEPATETGVNPPAVAPPSEHPHAPSGAVVDVRVSGVPPASSGPLVGIAAALEQRVRATFSPTSGGADPYGRTRVPSGLQAPRYVGLKFIALVFMVVGALELLFGVVSALAGACVSARAHRDPDLGSAFGAGAMTGGLFAGFIWVVGGMLTIGIGQLFSAFRDMAINSYVAVRDRADPGAA